MSQQEKQTAAARLFLDRIKEDHGIELLHNGGSLHAYRDGSWRVVTSADQSWLDPALFSACDGHGVDYGSKYNAVRRTIDALVMDASVAFDTEPYLVVPNGTLDLDPEVPELMDWSPYHYTTRRLAIEYDPDAECPEWEAMVLRMLEHPDRSRADTEAMAKFLQQWAGISLVGPLASQIRDLQKGLIIEGASHTGKTTFAEVMKELFGEARVVAPQLSVLGTEFGKESLLGAQAIISDDGISVDTVGDAKTLKAIVTGETMTTNRKYQSHVTFAYKGPVLFTTNTLPNIPDESDAIYNRFVVVTMDRVFTTEDQKKQLDGMKPVAFLKKRKEFPGILNWALRGFIEAFEQRHYSMPAEVQNAARMFRSRNDPVFAFVSECLVPDKKKGIPSNVLAAMAQEYAQSQHHTTSKGASLKRMAASLTKVVREVHRSVRHETEEGNSRNVTGYVGLRLNDLGTAYWNKVKEKGLAVVEGLKSPYLTAA